MLAPSIAELEDSRLTEKLSRNMSQATSQAQSLHQRIFVVCTIVMIVSVGWNLIMPPIKFLAPVPFLRLGVSLAFLPIGFAAGLLGVSPTHRRAVRNRWWIGVLTLGIFGLSMLALAVLAVTDCHHPHELACAGWALPCFLSSFFALTVFGWTFRKLLRSGMDSARGPLMHVWRIYRICFGFLGVLGAGWLPVMGFAVDSHADGWSIAKRTFLQDEGVDRFSDSNDLFYLTATFVWWALLAAAFGPKSHRKVQALMRKAVSSEQCRSAAFIAAMVHSGDGQKSVEASIAKAKDLFRALPIDQLTLEDLASNVDSGLCARTEKALLGSVDAFLSHSWRDPAEPKFAALTAWAREFETRGGASRAAFANRSDTQKFEAEFQPKASKKSPSAAGSFKLSTKSLGVGAAQPQFFEAGVRVVHPKHGAGVVTELQADGRSRVAFDNGEEHRYKASSMHKLRAESEADAAAASVRASAGQAKRKPLIWLDKACIQQTSIEEHLAFLPIFLSGCKKLLVTAGPTYASRLWCVFECFTFLKMGGTENRIELWPITRTADTELGRQVCAIQCVHTLLNFDAWEATCFKPEEKQVLIGVIEAGFGSLAYFNEVMQELLATELQLHKHQLLHQPMWQKGTTKVKYVELMSAVANELPPEVSVHNLGRSVAMYESIVNSADEQYRAAVKLQAVTRGHVARHHCSSTLVELERGLPKIVKPSAASPRPSGFVVSGAAAGGHLPLGF